MKKIIQALCISSAITVASVADIQLTLIDKDGNQSSQCIKSYSFSNNLESMARQKSALQDVYSTSETVTNKIYEGKPVYRKILNFGRAQGERSFPHGLTDYDKIWIVNHHIVFDDGQVYPSTYFAYYHNRSFFRIFPTKVTYYGSDGAYNTVSVILEYTKKADSVITQSKTEFKSYLHYIPSASTNNELVNVDLKETGVRFLDNYTYDSNTSSCTPSSN